MKPSNLVVLIAAFSLYVQAAIAHEFWIEPIDHTPEAGAPVQADLKVGQNYSGSRFPYLSNRYISFTITDRNGTHPYEGIAGDIPAVTLGDAPEGLSVIAYHSTPDTLVFREWETFTNYVAYEGNAWAIDAHIAAGLPKTGFSEAYTRCAKALVQVGAVTDSDVDRPVGLPLELVALQSPYLGEGDDIEVQLLWQGEPLADQQINIFHRDQEATLTSVKTDDAGRASIPSGKPGRYMLNAVRMDLTEGDAPHAWESFWASLTYEVAPR